MSVQFYQFPISKKALLSSYSPFCLKTEFYLKTSGISYESLAFTKPPAMAPGKKLPFIQDGEKKIPDSNLIIDYLKKTYQIDLDSSLTPSQKAFSLGMIRLLEEHLGIALVYFRWLDPSNWQRTKKIFFKGMPKLAQSIVPKIVQKKLKRDLLGHGLGRLSKEEILFFARQNLKALNDALEGSQGRFFFNDQITTLDTSAYGILANIKIADFTPLLSAELHHFPKLCEYIDRLHREYQRLS